MIVEQTMVYYFIRPNTTVITHKRDSALSGVSEAWAYRKTSRPVMYGTKDVLFIPANGPGYPPKTLNAWNGIDWEREIACMGVYSNPISFDKDLGPDRFIFAVPHRDIDSISVNKVDVEVLNNFTNEGIQRFLAFVNRDKHEKVSP